MPRDIVFALMIVTSVYVAVAVVAVAAQPWQRFEGQEAGLAQILADVTGSSVPANILAAGAVISIFSVTLVTLYGRPGSCSPCRRTGSSHRSSAR